MGAGRDQRSRPDVEQPPIFVITSGRAGSTMLARTLHNHPDLVCVSDLFEPVGVVPYLDRSRTVDTSTFLATLESPSLPDRIRFWRHQPTDELLFLPDDDERVSLLLSYTLPFLDPDGDPLDLLVALRHDVAQWPAASMADHFVRFAEWCRDRFDGRRWFERTGGSLPHVSEIVDAFPDGRFVHLHRDPAEVAISMQTGSFFRLYEHLESDPGSTVWDPSVATPIPRLAAMVDRWECAAADVWRSLPPHTLARLRYEQLASDPVRELVRLVEHLLDRPATDADRRWAARLAGSIGPAPTRLAQLSQAERNDVVAACAASRALLGYGADREDRAGP